MVYNGKRSVTKSTVAAYENDSRTPSYEVLLKLADVFKVSIDTLLSTRSEVVLDVSGLSTDQLEIIENLVVQFRKTNHLEEQLNDSI